MRWLGRRFEAQTAFFSTNEMELDIEPGDDITVLEQVFFSFFFFFFFLSFFVFFFSPFCI